jgi:hypothetical protein
LLIAAMRLLLTGLLAFTATLCPGSSRAEVGRPVFVTSNGPKTVKIRVAAGVVMPCDSMSNEKVYAGPIEANQKLALSTPAECVCVEHTYDDFPVVGWGAAFVVCRRQICVGPRWHRQCRPDPKAVINIEIQSKRPD